MDLSIGFFCFVFWFFWLKQQNVFPHSSGGWKFKIKVSIGLVSSEPTLLGLQMATFSPVSSLVFPLCTASPVFLPDLSIVVQQLCFTNWLKKKKRTPKSKNIAFLYGYCMWAILCPIKLRFFPKRFVIGKI